MGSRITCAITLALVFMTCHSSPAPALAADGAPSFRGLGHLPGATSSRAFAVSADGSVVTGNNGSRAFRWTAETGMLPLLNPGGTAVLGTPRGISADGSVVVGTTSTALGQRAFRWTEADGMTILPARPTDRDTFATSVSDDGLVTVGYSNSAPVRSALRWVGNGQPQDLGGFTTTNIDSYADGVSADGSVVVGTSRRATGGLRPFRWTADGGMVHIGSTSTADQPAYDVTPDGSVVVGVNFRWLDAGGYRQVPYGYAFGVSADGGTVVGGLQQAFIWTAHNETSRLLKDVLEQDYGLDLTGWTLGTAEDISNDGMTIVGFGTNPQGQSEAWIAVIPEPVGLCSFASAALLLRRKLRQPTRLC